MKCSARTCTREAVEGFRRCMGCRQNSLRSARKRLEAHRRDGLCHCGQSLAGNYSTCERCRTTNRKANRKRYAARRVDGTQCTVCGQTKMVNSFRCQQCQARKVYASRRRRNGYDTTRHLYVAQVAPYGFKVGSSVDAQRRMYGVKSNLRRIFLPGRGTQTRRYLRVQRFSGASGASPVGKTSRKAAQWPSITGNLQLRPADRVGSDRPRNPRGNGIRTARTP